MTLIVVGVEAGLAKKVVGGQSVRIHVACRPKCAGVLVVLGVGRTCGCVGKCRLSNGEYYYLSF